MNKNLSTPIPMGKVLILSMTIVAVLCAVIGNVVVSAQVSGVGQELTTLNLKTSTLSKSNARMELELAQKQSLAQTKVTAIAQGFIPRQSVVSLSTINAIARKSD